MTALCDVTACGAPLPRIGGRAADLLVISDCFVTPALAAALGARVADALAEGTTAVVVDPQRPTRCDFLRELRRRGVEGAVFCSVGECAPVVPGSGALHLLETDEGVPTFYEI